MIPADLAYSSFPKLLQALVLALSGFGGSFKVRVMLGWLVSIGSCSTRQLLATEGKYLL